MVGVHKTHINQPNSTNNNNKEATSFKARNVPRKQGFCVLPLGAMKPSKIRIFLPKFHHHQPPNPPSKPQNQLLHLARMKTHKLMRNFDGLGARFEQKNWRALLPLFFFLWGPNLERERWERLFQNFLSVFLGRKGSLKAKFSRSNLARSE